MRRLIKTLGWLLTLTTLLLAGAAALVALDHRPLVPEDRALSASERAWARQWLRMASPRGRREGDSATLILTEAEANVLASYLIDRLGAGRVAVRLERQRAHAAASLGLPWDPQDSFLNLELELTAPDGLPRVERARFAGLPLPSGLVQALAERLGGALDGSRLLRRVEFKPDLVRLTYEWHRDAIGTLGSGFMSTALRERVLHYQGLLADYAQGRPRREPFALADLLSRLLSEAGSATPATDPALENHAVLLALAAYANASPVRPPDQSPKDSKTEGRDAAPTIPKRFHRILLNERRDLAQHFLTSAALAAQAGDALSDLIGLYKEIADSDGGSGFSFTDLAADRAGTRFAGRATGDRLGALRVQDLARHGLAEGDFMPSLDGLQEGLSREEFAATFGDTSGPAYRLILDQIERRIDALPLHRTDPDQASR